MLMLPAGNYICIFNALKMCRLPAYHHIENVSAAQSILLPVFPLARGMAQEIRSEKVQRPEPVRYAVFDVLIHLRKCLIEALRFENRVPAEIVWASRRHYAALRAPHKHVRLIVRACMAANLLLLPVAISEV